MCRDHLPRHVLWPDALRTSAFSTTYSYTNIGKVDDPAGLEAALGSDDVVVTFEAKRQKE